MENWKKCKSLGDGYLVSDYGRIKRLPMIVKTQRGERHFKERFLRQTLRVDGYRVVGINGQSWLVHRLVAEAFLGDITGKEIDHIDYNRANNRLSNLQLLSSKENAARSAENMRRPKAPCWSNTSEKNIYLHKGKYLLYIPRHNYRKKYESIDEAIKVRNKLYATDSYYKDLIGYEVNP